MIPKVIHYCWFGHGDMSVLHQRCLDSWRLQCPGYEIKIWNESNSNIDNEYCRAAIAQRKWAFVADWVRFDVLAREGGVYLDTDLELIRDISPLLNSEICVTARESKRSIATAFIACMPGDPVMIACKNLIDKDLSARNTFTTSPEILKKAIADSGPERSVVLGQKSFYPFNPYERDNPDNALQFMYSDVTMETYGVHHYRLGEASWNDSRFRRALLKITKVLRITPKWQITYAPW